MLYRIETFLSPKIGHIMQRVYDELKNRDLQPDDIMISIEIVTVTNVNPTEPKQLELF